MKESVPISQTETAWEGTVEESTIENLNSDAESEESEEEELPKDYRYWGWIPNPAE